MRIVSAAELPTDLQGMWCRQSRLGGVVRFMVFSVVLVVPPVLGWIWNFRLQWALWLLAAAAVVVLPLLLVDLAAMFRAANWRLYIGPDGLWLNLRSYQDKRSTEAAAGQLAAGQLETVQFEVVQFEYGEIDAVGRHTERYSTPSEIAGPGSYGDVGGSTLWKDEFLEIRLNHEQTEELKTVVNRLRCGPGPGRASPRQAPRRSRYSSVWLVSPSVLRVTWSSGHGPQIRPSIGRMLMELAAHARLAEPTERQRPDWRKLTADEVAELARELIRVHAASLEATTLLVRAGGLAYAEAATQIRQIEAEEAC